MLKYELEKLEKSINDTYSNSTDKEVELSKIEIARLFENIQDTIVNNKAYISSKFSENIQIQFEKLMNDSLLNSRSKEQKMTMSNVEYMFLDKDFKTNYCENIENFKENGGIHRDNHYENEVKKIMEKVDEIYKKQLMSLNSREGEDAYYDVKRIVLRKTDNFIDMHKEFSENICDEVFKELDKLEINLSSFEKEQIEKQVKEHVEENDMMKTLKENIKSDAQIAKEDAQKLEKTDNERCFKDIPHYSEKKSKEDLEALFK